MEDLFRDEAEWFRIFAMTVKRAYPSPELSLPPLLVFDRQLSRLHDLTVPRMDFQSSLAKPSQAHTLRILRSQRPSLTSPKREQRSLQGAVALLRWP